MNYLQTEYNCKIQLSQAVSMHEMIIFEKEYGRKKSQY